MDSSRKFRLSPKLISEFQEMIFRWWALHARDLPWRHTRDPYRILVSEVMLQQTQVLRVISKYTEFLDTYPTVALLAQASPASVLRLWKGMGYNRRALYLQKTARVIIERHNGIFPDREQKLLMLPGVGKYTARAILVFAFEHDLAMVDTNIRQIIRQNFFGGTTPPESEIERVAEMLLPKGKSWEWHQALMDFGALALPKAIVLDQKPQKVLKYRAIPFRESNRYFRGRVIDRLRDEDMLEQDLVISFKESHGKPETFTRTLLEGLEKDGLITRTSDGLISLPK